MKRPYECNHAECGKSYTTRFSLRRHISSHSAIKEHVCVLCFKTFTLAQYLKEHMYIHTQQKPFKCDKEGCNRAFRQAGKLSMHKKIHQNIIFMIHKVKRKPVSAHLVEADKFNANSDCEKQSLSQEKPDDQINCMNRVTIPVFRENEHAQTKNKEEVMGEDTEHELSLSRHDDSDMSDEESIIYPAHHHQYLQPLQENEEAKQEAENGSAQAVKPVPVLIADMALHDESDSESLVDSSDGEMDQSVVDSEFLLRDEQDRIHMLLDRKRKTSTRLPCKFNSKVQLPNELLISKLIDTLAMPNILQQKELPLPTKDFEEEGRLQPLVKAIYKEENDKEQMAEQQEGAFNQLYQSHLPTSMSELEPMAQGSLLGSSDLKIQEPQQVQMAAAIASQSAAFQPMQLVQLQQTNIMPMAHQICYTMPQMPMQLAAQGGMQPVQIVQLVPATGIVPIQVQTASGQSQTVFMQITAPQPRFF